ncbi:MAG: VCBS repeat-containing protein [Acidobacteria bacterium]|nr:VCBS repeat-containing protein [Acidobacteriota bacterium]
MKRGLGRVAVLALVLGLAVVTSPGTEARQAREAPGVAANFDADGSFVGSSLDGWRPMGAARWRAENGEIVATPGTGGWLLSAKSYEDVAVAAAFRCAGACQTGVLVRAEPTPDGGIKGILISVTSQERASYQVTLDAQGKETSRKPLRGPAPGQLRVAPPPPPTPPAPPAASAGGPPPGPPPMPGGIPSPIARPEGTIKAGDWNTIEVVVDANIVRASLNDAAGIRDGVADPEFGAFGAIGLYASGEGEVRFRKVAFKDLHTRVVPTEHLSNRFRLQNLTNFYYSWGPSIADFDRDGPLDIVSGQYYYRGPSYTEARQIYIRGTIDPGTQYFNGLQYAYDFTGDGWPDVLNAEFQRQAILYVNPKGASRRWETYAVTDVMTCEFVLLKDIDGDGKSEFIFKDSQNKFVFATPDPAKPTAPWIKHAISEPGPWANHGMGTGDINGDGRVDFVNAFGWWEQPAAKGTTWSYHPAAFGKWTRSSPGGAEVAVYDVNGDGLNDIVTTLQAHGWGLSWFEQKKGGDGNRTFVEHPIMGNFATENAGGVTFSQLHGATFADIDGDGLPDFITGKRFWSHLDTFIDPDPHGAPVLYVYRTVRNPKAPGGAEFVPELVHNRSGVGSHVAVADLDKDGAAEIITGTKLGTFIFWNQWKTARR